MKFLSVCSGIEAASVAWAPLGWRAVGFSEIEPFPCSLLAHHYPHVPNLGDMNDYESWPDESIDALCGGTPCQSFSVAGLRAGLADPRGNLMLTFGAIAAKRRPRWLVWENVPGVLSSNGGRDFGAFLGLLGLIGYGFAYRVLDAQYFGVPQRRRRVFVVGYLGDWRPAAAVLFERHGLQGHPAPRRQAREGVAPSLVAGAGKRGGIQRDGGNGGLIPDVVGSLTASAGPRAHGGSGLATNGGAEAGHLISMCLNAKGGAGRLDAESETLIPTTAAPLPFDTTQMTSRDNRSNPQPGDPCHPLAAGAHAPAIAFNWQGGGTQTTLGYDPEAGTAGTLVKDQTQAVVAFQTRGSNLDVGSIAGTMGVNAGSASGSAPMMQTGMQVRRLTPLECERLQGFPDNYTLVPHRGKPAADGPRYKAIGNSWAVPCARWIGERIAMVEELL